jgi:hypothetical protein
LIEGRASSASRPYRAALSAANSRRIGSLLGTTRRRLPTPAADEHSHWARLWPTMLGVSQLARALVVGLLVFGLVSSAGARPQRSLGRFCGSVEGAPWMARIEDRAHGTVARFGGADYWVWRSRVDCTWAQQRVSFLSHALGTKYMKLAALGDFKCRALPSTGLRGPARLTPGRVLSLRPHRARGECWNTLPGSVARFEWIAAGLRSR